MLTIERVADVADLPEGGRLSVYVDDVPVLLLRIQNQYFAIEDVCSHDGQPLTDGELVGHEIECARHGGRFDLATGAAKCMPATEGVRVFSVTVKDGGLWCGPQSDVPAQNQTVAVGTGSAASGTDTATAVAAFESEGGVAGGPLDEGELLESLREVIDPELFVNIVDLGLIYGITAHEGKVLVDMTLTSPACPAGPQIIQQAKIALAKVPGVTSTEIKLTMTPPWSPERMTDEARDQLGIF